MTTAEQPMLLPLKQAAARLGIPESTLADMVRAKRVPHQRPNRRIYFTAGDLEAIARMFAAAPAAAVPDEPKQRRAS